MQITEKKLTGKVAVVTGASKGIGAAIAKAMAAEGMFGRAGLKPVPVQRDERLMMVLRYVLQIRCGPGSFSRRLAVVKLASERVGRCLAIGSRSKVHHGNKIDWPLSASQLTSIRESVNRQRPLEKQSGRRE